MFLHSNLVMLCMYYGFNCNVVSLCFLCKECYLIRDKLPFIQCLQKD